MHREPNVIRGVPGEKAASGKEPTALPPEEIP
jgi:hypothetical protein